MRSGANQRGSEKDGLSVKNLIMTSLPVLRRRERWAFKAVQRITRTADYGGTHDCVCELDVIKEGPCISKEALLPDAGILTGPRPRLQWLFNVLVQLEVVDAAHWKAIQRILCLASGSRATGGQWG